MRQQAVRVTDSDSPRLQDVIEGPLSKDPIDAGSVESLGRHLAEAEVPADRIGPDIVTINSEVRVRDLDTREAIICVTAWGWRGIHVDAGSRNVEIAIAAHAPARPPE